MTKQTFLDIGPSQIHPVKKMATIFQNGHQQFLYPTNLSLSKNHDFSDKRCAIMNEETTYISFNMTMPIETKWLPPICAFSLSQWPSMLESCLKLQNIIFMDRKRCCNSSNTIIPF